MCQRRDRLSARTSRKRSPKRGRAASPDVFSQRANPNPSINRLTLAREDRLRRGGDIFDLTVSNPTRASISYPLEELAEVMSRAARAAYDPQPLGITTAREAVAEH